jgi:5-hydroxyisourate hydrolase
MNEKSRKKITTHILDMVDGGPARGMKVSLSYLLPEGNWKVISNQSSDSDGRVNDFFGSREYLAGKYMLDFEAGAYLKEKKLKTVFSAISICFEVSDAAQHYHVPLLLSPNGYSTYRGS